MNINWQMVSAVGTMVGLFLALGKWLGDKIDRSVGAAFGPYKVEVDQLKKDRDSLLDDKPVIEHRLTHLETLAGVKAHERPA